MKRKTNVKKERDFYSEINRVVSNYEALRYEAISPYAAADRIVWLWKFRKITEDQMASLCERMTRIFEDGMGLYDKYFI